MSDARQYFIRTPADVARLALSGSRTPETLRTSLDGELVVVVLDPEDVPKGWLDGMTADQMRAELTSPEAFERWNAPE